MPKAVNKHTPSRRGLPSTLPSTAAAPAIAGTVAQASPDQDRPAELEDMAALAFEGDGGAEKEALGTLENWLKQAKSDFGQAMIAAAIMGKNDRETHELAQHIGHEATFQLIDQFRAMQKGYGSISALCEAVQLRLLAGAARLAMQTSNG